MVRSIFLRGFDQDMANKIGDYLVSRKLKFIRDSTPTKISKSENGKIIVDYLNTKDNKSNNDEFDTVIFAVGRSANTTNLGLDKIGVKVSKVGKVIVDASEKSNVDNIYAIGDCADERPELTPPAIIVIILLYIIKIK